MTKNAYGQYPSPIRATLNRIDEPNVIRSVGAYPSNSRNKRFRMPRLFSRVRQRTVNQPFLSKITDVRGPEIRYRRREPIRIRRNRFRLRSVRFRPAIRKLRSRPALSTLRGRVSRICTSGDDDGPVKFSPGKPQSFPRVNACSFG